MQKDLKSGGKKISKALVSGTFAAYIIYVLMHTRSTITRVASLYVYYLFFNPIYDSGLLLKVIYSGPSYFSQILSLDERKSFSKIQTELFIRH